MVLHVKKKKKVCLGRALNVNTVDNILNQCKRSGHKNVCVSKYWISPLSLVVLQCDKLTQSLYINLDLSQADSSNREKQDILLQSHWSKSQQPHMLEVRRLYKWYECKWKWSCTCWSSFTLTRLLKLLRASRKSKHEVKLHPKTKNSMATRAQNWLCPKWDQTVQIYSAFMTLE